MPVVHAEMTRPALRTPLRHEVTAATSQSTVVPQRAPLSDSQQSNYVQPTKDVDARPRKRLLCRFFREGHCRDVSEQST